MIMYRYYPGRDQLSSLKTVSFQHVDQGQEGGLLTRETLLIWAEDDGGSNDDADMMSEVSKEEFAGIDKYQAWRDRLSEQRDECASSHSRLTCG